MRARLLGVMSSADGLGLGAGAVMRAAGAGRASAETGDGRRGGLGVARRQHERRRETLPVDRVVRLEADQQLATGRYHLRRDLQCIHDTAFSFLLYVSCQPQHSNSRFESIRSLKKSAFRFTSCRAVFHAYLLYSLSQKNKLTSLL